MRNGGLAESRRVGWLIAGVLSVVTAGWGLLEPGIYVGLIAPATRPGALSQDVITVIAGVALCGLALAGTRVGPKAVGQFRDRSWAVVLAPVMFVLGAVLIFSLALGELVKPAFGSPVTMAGLLPPTLLTTLFLALAVLHLKKLSFRPSTHSPTQPGLLSQSSVDDPPAEMATHGRTHRARQCS